VRLLVDSHVLIWYVSQDKQLSSTARDAITQSSNQLFLSVASLWEIAIKVGLQKLTLSSPYFAWMTQAVADVGLQILPISLEHCDRVVNLPRHHGDPFDRIMIVQAVHEQLEVVSHDAQFDSYGVHRIW
jgi:PIN domain nuclease of toxin-antitoxin system